MIVISGLVAMKIIKHCNDHAPLSVSGALVGVAAEMLEGACQTHDATLEVTNCYGIPSTNVSADYNAEEYQFSMLKNLVEVNIDNSVVGWYTSDFNGYFLTQSNLATQLHYELSIPNSIMITFDSGISNSSTLALKAYRLNPKFVSLCKTRLATEYAGAPLTSETISDLIKNTKLSEPVTFDELPIQVRNSSLTNAFLLAAQSQMNLSTRPPSNSHVYLERNLEYLTDCCDELVSEKNKYNHYLRTLAKQKAQVEQQRIKIDSQNKEREAKNLPLLSYRDDEIMKSTPQPPNKLDSSLITSQIETYCEQIKSIASTTLDNLKTVEALQK